MRHQTTQTKRARGVQRRADYGVCGEEQHCGRGQGVRKWWCAEVEISFGEGLVVSVRFHARGQVK